MLRDEELHFVEQQQPPCGFEFPGQPNPMCIAYVGWNIHICNEPRGHQTDHKCQDCPATAPLEEVA